MNSAGLNSSGETPPGPVPFCIRGNGTWPPTVILAAFLNMGLFDQSIITGFPISLRGPLSHQPLLPYPLLNQTQL